MKDDKKRNIMFSRLCLNLLNEKETRDLIYDLIRSGHEDQYLQKALINEDLTLGQLRNLVMKSIRGLGFDIADIASCLFLVSKEVARKIVGEEDDLYQSGRILSGLSNYFDYPYDPFFSFIGLVSAIEDVDDKYAKDYYERMKDEASVVINWESLPYDISQDSLRRYLTYVESL